MGAFQNLKDKLLNNVKLPLLSVVGAASLSSCADVGAGYGGLSMPPANSYGNNQVIGGQNRFDQNVAADRVRLTQLSREYSAARKAGDYQTADQIQYEMYVARQQYNDDRRQDAYSDQSSRYRDRNVFYGASMPQRILGSAERSVENNIKRAVNRSINDAMRGLKF